MNKIILNFLYFIFRFWYWQLIPILFLGDVLVKNTAWYVYIPILIIIGVATAIGSVSAELYFSKKVGKF